MLYCICYIRVYTGFNIMYIHVLRTPRPHIDLSGHLCSYVYMYMSDCMYCV